MRIPYRRGKKKNKKKEKGTSKSSASDDESVGSLPSQIGFSDASNNLKQLPGESTRSKARPGQKQNTDVDDDTVNSTQTGVRVDPNVRKRAITEKNASSKHNLGVFYLSKREWEKAQGYLNIALEARKEVYGKKDGRVAETESYLAEVLAALGEKDEAIALLKKAQASIKALREHKGAEEEESKNDTDVEADLLKKPLDLDKLQETCIQKLEDLGVKTNKLVRKNASNNAASGQEVFGQDYNLMKSKGRSLSDPDVFLQVMKMEDLSQEDIAKGMKALNDEVPDQEIYFSDPFDADFANVPIAPAITVVLQDLYHAEDDLALPDTSDESEKELEEQSIHTMSTNVDGGIEEEDSKGSKKKKYF